MAATLMNAIKECAGTGHEEKLVSAASLESIQELRTRYLGSRNPRLHSDEMLIALSSSAAGNDHARLALEHISDLRGAEIYCAVILSSVDENIYRKLGIQLTCSPVYEKKMNL